MLSIDWAVSVPYNRDVSHKYINFLQIATASENIPNQAKKQNNKTNPKNQQTN